jgi:Rieske Fe-S protein
VSDLEGRAGNDPALTLNRRVVLSAAGLSGVALVVSACGSTGSSAKTPSPSTKPSATNSTAHILGSTMAIPVGGGVIYPDQAVVVTQPTAGVYKGFSAICPHQGCTVGQIAQGLIICPCHLSTFSIKDGSVQQGPAQTGLPPVAVKVVGTDVVVS